MGPLLEKRTGKKIGWKRLRRLMKENDLQSTVRPKKYSDEVYARRKKMKEALPPDLIHRNFWALEPFKRFMEDITYLPCLEQTIYLNTIADYYNAEIHAFRFSEYVDARLCTDTLRDLGDVLKALHGAILHSDGGTTYIAYIYTDLMEKLHMLRSMGHTGVCYDNSPMESLNGIIKTECLYCRFGKSNVVNHRVPKKDVMAAVIEFIEFYNTKRPKEKLGFQSPLEFRLQNPKGTYPVPISK